MALSSLRRLRLRIADLPRRVIDEQIGVSDGCLAAFQTQLWPLVENSETVLVKSGDLGTVQIEGLDYGIESDTGVVIFVSAPEADAEIFISYRWTIFSDGDLEDLLDQHGGHMVQAAMGAIQWLLADSDRFIKYTFGQETVDRTGARQGLLDLYELLQTNLDAPVGLVKAQSDDREALMSPFVEQGEAL